MIFRWNVKKKLLTSKKNKLFMSKLNASFIFNVRRECILFFKLTKSELIEKENSKIRKWNNIYFENQLKWSLKYERTFDTWEKRKKKKKSSGAWVNLENENSWIHVSKRRDIGEAAG